MHRGLKRLDYKTTPLEFFGLDETDRESILASLGAAGILF